MATTKRTRINPHKQGTPEHYLFARWRAAMLKARQLGEAADRFRVGADAENAKAATFAVALGALGHPPDGATKLLTIHTDER